MPCIALVAGEASGDILGAGLMAELRLLYPDVRFIGVGGPRMEAKGMQSLFPMECLAVMGLVEILGRLPELLRRRRSLILTLLAEKPDLFIGIDAPDFNLGIELQLRKAGIRTAHYVSPSIWAWRQRRVFKVREACDLMLTLLPFEARFYEEHGVPVCFVGHPLADTIPLEVDRGAARAELGVSESAPLLALMPGSRGGEVQRLAPPFLKAALLLRERNASMHFVIPCANAARREQLEQLLQDMPGLPIMLLDGQSHLALAACDAVLIASGTATLEALLYERPMVAAYRLSPLTYRIARPLVKTPYFSLPNLLVNRMLVPELLQDEVTGPNLADAVQKLFDGAGKEQVAIYAELHQSLRRQASQKAAQAVAALIG